MPVYNGEQYISEAIESVLAQTYHNFELIIVNDGSTDNSKSIIESYLGDSRILYFYQKNMGVSSARNLAIRKSKGELISFLDSDDLWHPKKLEVQIEYIKKYPNAHLVFTDYIIRNEIEGTHKNSSEFTPKNFRECNIKDLFFQNYIGILTILVKKNCLKNHDIFDIALKGSEDYELWLRLALDYNLHYIPQPVATYRWHGTNTSCDKLMMAKQEAKAICFFLEKRPDAYKVLGKRIIKTRLFNLYDKIGDLYIWHLKNTMDAQQFYLLAFKQKPFSLKTWKLLKKVIRSSKTYDLMKYYQMRILSVIFGQKKH